MFRRRQRRFAAASGVPTRSTDPARRESFGQSRMTYVPARCALRCRRRTVASAHGHQTVHCLARRSCAKPASEELYAPAMLRATEAALASSEEDARSVGGASDEPVLAAVERVVEQLNVIDEEHGTYCTIEREDLCDYIGRRPDGAGCRRRGSPRPPGHGRTDRAVAGMVGRAAVRPRGRVQTAAWGGTSSSTTVRISGPGAPASVSRTSPRRRAAGSRWAPWGRRTRGSLDRLLRRQARPAGTHG